MSARLVALPRVLPLEAPSSWLTRAALSQGVNCRELLRFLGIDGEPDSDLAFLGERFPLIAAHCGFEGGEFQCVRQIAESLNSIGRAGKRLLLHGKRDRPRYRICPLCAAEQQTPYLPFHCRFSVWRYCVIHECMLEDACWNCGAPIELPVSLAVGRAAALQCAYLSQCVCCGKSHAKAKAMLLSDTVASISEFERLILANGRATLAALMYRRVEVRGGKQHGLGWLTRMERMGLLGSRGSLPTAEMLRLTLAARIYQAGAK